MESWGVEYDEGRVLQHTGERQVVLIARATRASSKEFLLAGCWGSSALRCRLSSLFSCEYSAKYCVRDARVLQPEDVKVALPWERASAASLAMGAIAGSTPPCAHHVHGTRTRL